ncbi:MAG: proline racemase [Clostridiaceae bacterium]
MKANKIINAIDSHTAGEPTRIVVSGIPHIPGKNMPEKKLYLEEHMDYIRESLMHEPRGHKDMFGSIITAPTMKDADLGIIFMDGAGYLNMCGHGSIGAATAAVETGMVTVNEPITEIGLETPAGLVKARVSVEDGIVQNVTIRNVPAFLYKENVEVDVPGVGKIILDVSFGGSFFAIVNVKQFGLKVCIDNLDELVPKALATLNAVNKQVKVQHPEKTHIKTIDIIEVYDEQPTNPEATMKNVVIWGQGSIDRSPCGTGTSAKMATLYAKGKLSLNEEFVYESILGTIFRGILVENTYVGEYKAVIPEITGNAYITGFNQFVFSENDPLKHGFVLR